MRRPPNLFAGLVGAGASPQRASIGRVLEAVVGRNPALETDVANVPVAAVVVDRVGRRAASG